MRWKQSLPITLVLLALLSATPLFAAGSKEKTPAEKASEDARKATSAYNDGVQKMEKADEIGLAADPAYTYDYGVAPDAKALKGYEKAVADFQKAVALDPKMKEAHNNLGYCFRKLGKLEESLTAYDKAIALDPNFAQAREYRGETYLALGRLEDAKAELAWLQGQKSKYADQLARSIQTYADREAQKTVKLGGK